jgi:hypothetical protein
MNLVSRRTRNETNCLATPHTVAIQSCSWNDLYDGLVAALQAAPEKIVLVLLSTRIRMHHQSTILHITVYGKPLHQHCPARFSKGSHVVSKLYARALLSMDVCFRIPRGMIDKGACYTIKGITMWLVIQRCCTLALCSITTFFSSFIIARQ